MSSYGDVSSSSPVALRLRWDVFLSFGGADTRHAFAIPLYEALKSRRVRVFLDDVGLDRGDQIAPSLIEAIDDSAASIIIFSPRYASSHWCLEELARICDCRRLILPVFFNVDPRDVRKQGGPFRGDFENHEAKRSKEDVSKWRAAMKKVGGIAGFPVWHPSEEEDDLAEEKEERDDLIQLLVKRTLRELINAPVGMAEFTVGLDDRIERLLELVSNKF